MQDGYTQMGAGDSDMRVGGKDLQHHRQPRTADENPAGIVRKVTHSYAAGGPMKQMLNDEMQRHKESKMMRLEHLEKHYKR